MTELFAELEARGLLHPPVDPELAGHLGEKRTVYCGFDPSSSSLQLGNLLGVATLMRFQRAGHRVIALLGGGTGAIGDPSGKSEERTLLSREQLEHNKAAICGQLASFLGVDLVDAADPRAKDAEVIVVDNAEWLEEARLLDFLRDIGKHFTVNQMIAKDSVSARLTGRDQGISFTEFTYQALQAYDFLMLHDLQDCTIQLGGTDQWGNISEGVSLIRRVRQAKAFGVVWPLMTRADGTKFGKSDAAGVPWLDAKMMSPYQFYQLFIHAEDEKVGNYLRTLTFLPLVEIEELEQQTLRAPEQRLAQRALAREVTTLVHGSTEAATAENAAGLVFSDEIRSLDEPTLVALFSELPSVSITAGSTLLDAVAVAFDKSKSATRTALAQNGISVNNVKTSSEDVVLSREDALHNKYFLLRWGKKDARLVSLDG